MQIYESAGYSQRDAAKSILENNIYGLDIDDRAYQLAYFAVMMKARQYNRRILNGENSCHVYAIQESNSVNRAHLKYFGAGMDDIEKNAAKMQLEGLLDTLTDAKEYALSSMWRAITGICCAGLWQRRILQGRSAWTVWAWKTLLNS